MVLDYGIRTSVRVRRARRRLDLLVLDRYWHDVIVDLSAGGEMAKPPRLLTMLLPRPDLVLVLELPEEQAIVRQPDALDLTHLRQRRRLYGVVASQPDAALVDASGTESAVSEAVRAAATPVAPGGERMSDQPLIILGVDGLDWEYVDAHRDELPTLAAWPQLQSLRSVFPPDSIAAWTTIFTGIPPGDHGFLDSIDYLSRQAGQRGRGGRRDALGRDVLGRGRRAGAEGVRDQPVPRLPGMGRQRADDLGAGLRERRDLGDRPRTRGARADSPAGRRRRLPDPRTMGPFIDETFATTRQQADFGMRMLELTQPDLFFLNVLTLDRLQHFVWRFADPEDPTYPGPNPHGGALLDSYRLIDRIAAEYGEHGRVLVISDHGHGQRPTRMVFIDEALRRAGLLREARTAPKLMSRTYLARAREAARLELHVPVVAGGAGVSDRPPPSRPQGDQGIELLERLRRSPARLSRTFGRNRHSGIELGHDTSESRQAVLDVLSGLRDPETGEGVVDWAEDREEVVKGRSEDRYPEILFRLRNGYGVDYGLYGAPVRPRREPPPDLRRPSRARRARHLVSRRRRPRTASRESTTSCSRSL